ncbi:MAG: OB-fold domain-containing protein [Rhodobacteraceae bacterium]|jgi:uncharacterized OB-fold protein|nr:OB-fold domain-containing protein [Paracoccaceae bacterium]
MTDPATLSPRSRFLWHAARGELAFQRSGSGRAVFHPRAVDPDTGAEGMEWEVSAGLGRIHSLTVVHPQGEPPFALALVDLDEGFRMMSRIDCDDPASVPIGARVRAGFRPLAAGEPPLPVFAPAEAGA